MIPNFDVYEEIITLFLNFKVILYLSMYCKDFFFQAKCVEYL